jgi:hypothetical protein
MQQYLPAFLKAIFDLDPSILEQLSAEQAKRTSILTETCSVALAEIKIGLGTTSHLKLKILIQNPTLQTRQDMSRKMIRDPRQAYCCMSRPERKGQY